LLARSDSLCAALIIEGHIMLALQATFSIPAGFTMANENQAMAQNKGGHIKQPPLRVLNPCR
jgi:hypothetical protein